MTRRHRPVDPHRPPHVSAVRGGLRTRDHGRATRRSEHGDPHPRRPRRRVHEGLHLPQGLDAEAAPRGSGSVAPAARQARRRACRGVVGRGVGGGRARPRRRHRASRARGARRVPRQPDGAQPRGDDVHQSPDAGARHAAALQRVDGRPDAPPGRGRVRVRIAVTVPVPDLDRTDYLLVLGANPYASNGSLCTAPDFPGRIEAMQARGGKLVVVDPRRSRTAEQADEWLPIRPGSDALLLAAIVNVLIDEGLADPGPMSRAHLSGLDDVVPRWSRSRPRRSRPRPASMRRPSADRTRAGGGPDRRCVRPDRHDHHRVRDDRLVADRRRQHLDRQPRSAGWIDVRDAGRRGSDDARWSRHGTGFRIGRGHSPRERSSRRLQGSTRRPTSPRRSSHRARDRSAVSSRSPATRCCRRRTPTGSAMRSRISSSWSASTST